MEEVLLQMVVAAEILTIAVEVAAQMLAHIGEQSKHISGLR